MKTALLTLLVASVAFADDAPKVVVLAPGEAAPSQGLFLPEPVAIEQAKRIKACEAERDALKQPPVALIVASIVGGLLVGGAVGAGVAVAVKK